MSRVNHFLVNSSKSVFFSLALLVIFNLAECAQFYDHPFPIPSRSFHGRSFSSSHGANGYQSPSVDPAVQFLVSNDIDGSYHFGFDTGGKQVLPTYFREETRDSSGRIVGRYGYLDPAGFLRITEYVADSNGFRSTESKRLLFDNSNLQLIGPIPSTKSSFKNN